MSGRGLTRRSFLALTAAAGAMALGASCDRGGPVAERDGEDPVTLGAGVVPHDAEPHRRTWMAWPGSREIWGGRLPGIQRDIALVASAIARFEPVVMCANHEDTATASRMCGVDVEVTGDIPVDDCWMRDSGPVFTVGPGGEVAAVGLNFNGWGDRQIHPRDALVAQRIAERAGVPFVAADLVSEGGAIETDGEGTLLATESSIVNDNRNPGRSRDDLAHAMVAAYGAELVLWLPGLRDHDITDDHIDATSRFVSPGVVLVQVPPSSRTDAWAEDARTQRAILTQAADARGRRLTVVDVLGPRTVRSASRDFLDSYVNFFTANGAVISSQFGDDQRDREAAEVLADAFPGREVVQLDVDRLQEGGGGIHCVTQPEPRSR